MCARADVISVTDGERSHFSCRPPVWCCPREAVQISGLFEPMVCPAIRIRFIEFYRIALRGNVCGSLNDLCFWRGRVAIEGEADWMGRAVTDGERISFLAHVSAASNSLSSSRLM